MDFHLFSIIVDFFHIYFFFQSHLNPILILFRSLFSGRFSIDLSEACLCMLFFYYNILLCVRVFFFFQQKIHVCKNDKHRTGLVVDNRLIQKTNRRSGFQSKCQQYILFHPISHSPNHALAAFINGKRKTQEIEENWTKWEFFTSNMINWKNAINLSNTWRAPLFRLCKLGKVIFFWFGLFPLYNNSVLIFFFIFFAWNHKDKLCR